MGLDVSFPAEDSRCEGCGYALRGLDAAGDCPECGLAIAESSPAKRVGLPWQREMNFKSWLKTTWLVLTRPSWAFRHLLLQADQEKDWRFLFSHVGLVGVVPALGLIVSGGWVSQHDRSVEAVLVAFVSLVGSLLLLEALLMGGLMIATTIEAMGVCYFSGKRGWAISHARARQICSYAGVGWLWTPVFLITAYFGWVRSGHPDVRDWPLPQIWLLLLLLTCGSVIWFETLVWIGIRQVRFGNAGPEAPRGRPPEVPPGGAGG
ncbi:MAG: hypothetical protein IT442_03550 [Phycisphaeraceae bacterium]|nr:hypothetical protein [Phycisphaeraceae bacterium]